MIPNSSCKSHDALRLTLHLSSHTQDGTNDDLISTFIVPELTDFKEAILKYGGVFGTYFALWVMLYLPDLYLLNDYDDLTFLSFFAEQWATLPCLPGQLRSINTSTTKNL